MCVFRFALVLGVSTLLVCGSIKCSVCACTYCADVVLMSHCKVECLFGVLVYSRKDRAVFGVASIVYHFLCCVNALCDKMNNQLIVVLPFRGDTNSVLQILIAIGRQLTAKVYEIFIFSVPKYVSYFSLFSA